MQDVQYADIDHYDDNKVFTVDDKAFAGLSEYFDGLRRDGMHTIIILVHHHQHYHHHQQQQQQHYHPCRHGRPSVTLTLAV